MRPVLLPRQRPLLTAFAVAILCLALVAPLATQNMARAQGTILVTTNADSGAGSLRQAVLDVEDGDTITFVDGLETIDLTEQIVINKSLTIAGPGADMLTIRSNGSDRVFGIQNTLDTIEVAIRGVTISGGRSGVGGGIYLNTATLAISDSVISGNTVADEDFPRGGGIHAFMATLIVENSTIADNVVENGDGGGIYNRNGHLTVINSTISGNTVTGEDSTGGGIYNAGELTIINSTISGNDSGRGGAISSSTEWSIIDSNITITSSTIADNSAHLGAGIWIGDGHVNIENTIIANTLADNANCVVEDSEVGSITSLGYNLVNDASCFLTAAGDMPSTNPLLGDLAGNGGPTWTHAIGPNSPAVNAIPAEACVAALGAEPVDQRGIDRPQFGTCDIGAFELSVAPEAPVVNVPDDMTVPASGPDGALVKFEATALDWNSAQLDVTCDPESGSTFDIGTTEVECRATDRFQQTTTESFSVTVLGEDVLLAALIEDVQTGDIPAFLKPRLLVFLTTADLALEQGNTAAACHTLQSFTAQVTALSPSYITPALVSELTDDTQAIRNVLGCSVNS